MDPEALSSTKSQHWTFFFLVNIIILLVISYWKKGKNKLTLKIQLFILQNLLVQASLQITQ